MLESEQALRRFASEVRSAFPGLDMNLDAEWIAAAHGWPENDVLFVADRDRTRISGFAAFLISKARLVYSLGPIALLKPAVRQLKLYQGVKCVTDDPSRSIGACFKAVFDSMQGSDLVFAGAIPTGSDLHGELVRRGSALRRWFYVLPWGGESLHCRVRWNGTLDAYLASIGKKSGKELQRNAKLLLSDPGLKCELRRFRSLEDAETFLRDGTTVSDKTYQKRDLGLGISRGGAVERVIRFAAARDAFLGYILYINDAPAAFRYGFKCGNTCTMKQTGYDPQWADRQIGSVLFFEVMRDFAAMKLDVEWLDFMPDINLFKLRTTNERRTIRHYYLFRRTAMGALQYFSLKATDWLSRAVGSLIKKPEQGELEKYLARIESSARKA